MTTARTPREEIDRLRGAVEAIEEAITAVRQQLHLLDLRLRQPTLVPPVSTPVPRGHELRQRRLALGVSQTAVADVACCSRGLLSDLERGRRSSIYSRSHVASVLGRLEARQQPMRQWA
jgi:helix-turn-helix protein